MATKAKPKEKKIKGWEERLSEWWWKSEPPTKYEDVKRYVEMERTQLLKEIKRWTKGRNVTKDSLRHYLNELLNK